MGSLLLAYHPLISADMRHTAIKLRTRSDFSGEYRFGIYMGRRFKPKWGPNSALMSFSDPRSSLDPKVPFNDTRRGESDMPYYILSQLQVGSLLSSGIEYPKSLMGGGGILFPLFSSEGHERPGIDCFAQNSVRPMVNSLIESGGVISLYARMFLKIL
ncbi:hypothetical protein QAD02_002537 [Eretmocerus hayati]|uniref:Uncharacterized protein n=1 Tax=Eretmocerus hayati TaxID=131215 RepID=A0ACC2NK61_9HYME|nr:hypothetical protein QAD02_002537 [Eretmocerus hayati]